MNLDNSIEKDLQKLKKIEQTLPTRKLYNRGTAKKSQDEKLVTQWLRVNGISEPDDLLTRSEQYKIFMQYDYLVAFAETLKLPLYIASKISLDEIDNFKLIDTYHEMLKVINNVFDSPVFFKYTKKQIDTTIDVLKIVGASVPVELVYANSLCNQYNKNQKSKALEDLLVSQFPKMKQSNIKAIISSR